MSGTELRNRIAGRAAVASAAAALLLAGCGGGGGYGSDAAATPAADSSAPSGSSDFCSQAADIDDRVDAAVADLGDDPSLPDAFRKLTEELRDIEAPAAIAADWETMAGGLERMADAFADVDFTDPSTLDALDAAEGDLSAASDRVDTYLHDECGITP
jgi:hypothetical protein